MSTMTCDACRDLLPWYAARLLDGDDHDHVERHLATCAGCRAELAAWRQIASATNDNLSHVTPSVATSNAWKQLQEHITPDPSANGRRRGDMFMEFGDQPESIDINTIHTRPSATARRRVTALVAALLVVIVGAAGFWFFAPQPHPKLIINDAATATRVSATATPPNVPGIFLTPGTLVTPASNPRTDPIEPPTMGKSYTTVNSLPVIKNQTSLFLPSDTVIVVAKVEGAKAKDTVSVKWFQNNEDLTPAFITSNSNCCSQTMSGQPEDVLFQASFPSVGLGRAELYYNTTLEYTIVFDVVPQTALYPPTPHS